MTHPVPFGKLMLRGGTRKAFRESRKRLNRFTVALDTAAAEHARETKETLRFLPGTDGAVRLVAVDLKGVFVGSLRHRVSPVG